MTMSFNRYFSLTLLVMSSFFVQVSAQQIPAEEDDLLLRVCPTCTTSLTGSATFCNATITTNLNAANLCVTGAAQIGTLTVCNGIILPGTAFAFGYNTALSLGLTGGTPTLVPFATAVAPVQNITPSGGDTVFTLGAAAGLAGTYLVEYIVEPTTALGQATTFTLLHNGGAVAGSAYAIAANTVLDVPAVGQALVTLAPGDTLNLQATAATTTNLTGTASITMEKIA